MQLLQSNDKSAPVKFQAQRISMSFWIERMLEILDLIVWCYYIEYIVGKRPRGVVSDCFCPVPEARYVLFMRDMAKVRISLEVSEFLKSIIKFRRLWLYSLIGFLF